MSIRDVGSYIGFNRVASTTQNSASGIWSLAAVERRMRAAAWPVRPIDPNFSQVSLLLRGEGGQIVDASERTKTFTLGGSVAFSSAQSRFGGGSAYLPGGASDKITVASTADFAFGTGDFTVEFFYYYTPVNAGEYRLTSFGAPANQFANLASGWQGYGLSIVNESVSHFLPVGGGPTANQWDHIAYERYNGTFYLYLNGALLGNAYANINTPTTGLEIYGHGYVDQFRVTKSVARYQGAAFTPPVDAFPDEGPPPAEPLTFAAAYQGSSSALPQGNTSGNAYSISGDGTSAAPLSLVIGGTDNCVNRVWVAVNQTGTLNWTVTSSSESGYDYGRLYKHSGPVNTTILSPNGSVPAGFTAISDARSGAPSSSSGTVSVTAGEFLVLAYVKDDSGDSGSDTVTLSAHIS